MIPISQGLPPTDRPNEDIVGRMGEDGIIEFGEEEVVTANMIPRGLDVEVIESESTGGNRRLKKIRLRSIRFGVDMNTSRPVHP